jgi:hypothetical protein
MKVVSVKLPENLFLDISREASRRKVTRSEVIRDRLSAKTPTKASLWDQMEDLVIHDDMLPKDLSANKAHLKKYGQNCTR